MKITVTYLFPIHNGIDEFVPLNLSSKRLPLQNKNIQLFNVMCKIYLKDCKKFNSMFNLDYFDLKY